MLRPWATFDNVVSDGNRFIAVFRVRPMSYPFASIDDRRVVFDRLASGCTWLVDAKTNVLFLAVNRTIGSNDLESKLLDPSLVGSDRPAWRDLVAIQAKQFEAQLPAIREYYLCAELGVSPKIRSDFGKAIDWLKSQLGFGERTLGPLRVDLDEEAYKAMRAESNAFFTRYASQFGLIGPASYADVVWLHQRALLRGIADPERFAGVSDSADGASTTDQSERIMTHQAVEVLRGDGTKVRRAVTQPGLFETTMVTETYVGPRGVLSVCPGVGSSWQATLILATAQDTQFPGRELFYDTECAFAFPIDVAIRLRPIPVESARKQLKDKQRNIEDTILQNDRMSEEAVLAKTYGSLQRATQELALSKHPLMSVQVMLTVWAPTEEVLAQRVNKVRQRYGDAGFEFYAARGMQAELLQATLPTGSILDAGPDLAHVVDYRYIASGMPFATNTIGDSAGGILGIATEGTARVAMFDPFRASLVGKPPAAVFTGTLGGGKSYTTKMILESAIRRGARVLVVDPKDEYHRLCALHPDEAKLVKIGGDSTTIMDPLLFLPMRTEQERVEVGGIARDFLIMLTQVRGDSDEVPLIGEAIEEVLERCVLAGERPSLRKVAERLQEKAAAETIRNGGVVPQTPLQNIHRRVADARKQPFAQQAFGDPATHPVFELGEALTVVQIGSLQLPADKDDLTERRREGKLSGAEAFGLAFLFLISNIGLMLFRERDKSRLRIVVIDEAWAITSTSEGSNLCMKLARLGRSANAALFLISQSPDDIPESVMAFTSCRFAFRSPASEKEARAALKMLGVIGESDKVDAARVIEMQELTRQVMFRDLDGVVGKIQVRAPDDRDLLWAFSSNASDSAGIEDTVPPSRRT